MERYQSIFEEQHKTAYPKGKDGKKKKVVYDDATEYIDSNGNKQKKKKKVEGSLRESQISPRDIAKVFNVDMDTAKQISDLTKKSLSYGKENFVLDEINKLVGGYGVEAITHEDAYVDRYYFNIIATYVNMGDTYKGTIVHDSDTGEFLLTSWGNFYEEWEGENL